MYKLLLACLSLLLFPHPGFAACFLATKNGNIRSGPSTKHEIIGHVKEWEIIELPGGVDWHGNWLCIEKRIPLIQKRVRKRAWSVYMSAGQWGAFESRLKNPNEPLVTINLLYSEDKKGAFVKFTGERNGSTAIYSQEVVYYPIEERVKTEYIHKSLGRIVWGTYLDIVRRVSAVQENRRWPKRIKDSILTSDIQLGMSRSQVTASWGRPDDINRTVTQWGVSEQWVYGDVLVYFEDGKLTAWQD